MGRVQISQKRLKNINNKNMAKTAQEILDAIYEHLEKSSATNYSDFYIGITNDVERRLFNEHNVPRENHWRIHDKAVSKASAQKVEEHFLDKGMKGDTGGGTDDSVYVYCYEISRTKKE